MFLYVISLVERCCSVLWNRLIGSWSQLWLQPCRRKSQHFNSDSRLQLGMAWSEQDGSPGGRGAARPIMSSLLLFDANYNCWFELLLEGSLRFLMISAPDWSKRLLLCSDSKLRSGPKAPFCPFVAYMLPMYRLIVYYSCHCEWGERKALPVIVCRGWTDAEMVVIVQLFPLSPLVSHRLYENEPNWGHLACKPAYSWINSCRNGAVSAQTLSFWTDKLPCWRTNVQTWPSTLQWFPDT